MSTNPEVRRQSRELALQVLFQKEFIKKDLNTLLDFYKQNFKPEPPVLAYAQEILFGIEENQVKIDALISENSSHWTIDRMALVDLNLLRLSVFEIEIGKTAPPKVVINEALEIAKKYGSNDSKAFINGILDQLYKKQTS